MSVFFFERVKLSVLLWTSLFLFGLFSYTVFMQRQGFPQIDLPVSIVNGVYFVDDKSKVDDEVAKPILETISEVSEIESTSATITDNQFTIVVNYGQDLSSADGSKLVEEKVSTIKSELPNQAQILFQPIDATKYANKYSVLVSVNGQLSIEELEAQAEIVASELSGKLPTAENVEIVSNFEEAVDPRTGQTVSQQTSFDRFGEFEDGQGEVLRSVSIGIAIPDDADIIAFDNELTSAIEQVSANTELTDVNINISASSAPSIREQISSLQGNLFAGLAVIVIICLIFIGWRAGILAAAGLAVSITTAVGIMYLLGISLNTISLFGLVLCLGLIVDDTIIIVESLDATVQETKDLKDAVKKSISKIALASAAGTFTTVLGFAPLLFITGVLGEFIWILPVTIIIVLIVSLIMSLLFIPFLSQWFLSSKPGEAGKGPFGFIRKFEIWASNFLSGFIIRANTRKKKVITALVGILISFAFIFASGPVAQNLKFDIFPAAKDTNIVSVSYNFAPGVDINQAEAIVDSADQKIVEVVGSDIASIAYNATPTTRSAEAYIQLTPYQSRDVTSKDYQLQLQSALDQVEGAQIVVNQIGAGPPKEQYPFSAQIKAENPQQATVVALNLKEFLSDKTLTVAGGEEAQIVDVQFLGEAVAITRKDGERILEVKASYNSDETTALVQETQKLVEDEFLTNQNNLNGLSTEDVTFDFGFESENQESFQSVIIAFPLLVIAIYFLLAIQFRSFLQPILILVAVPFSIFGVVTLLFLTNNPLSFFVMIALLALIGISVNNTILLTDYANQNRKAGMSPRYAVADALSQRTRPLLTTSLTSVLALLPLALSDPFWESLAFTLIGGLISSAVLVLLSFPYYYLVLEALRSRAQAKWRNRKS